MGLQNQSCLLIADFVVDPMVAMLKSAAEPPVVSATVAPFDQVVPVLLNKAHRSWHGQPDFAVVWTRPEAAVPRFARLMAVEAVPETDLLAEVDTFARHLAGVADRLECVFVPSWTLPPYERGMGLLDMRRHDGLSQTLMRMNLRLAEALVGCPNVYVLDAGRWLALAGGKATNPKLWFMAKMTFGLEMLREAAADIKAALRAIAGDTHKLVVLDLDDTLWGGVVGDIGWQDLELGGHSPIGEAFTAFQTGLKSLANRGVLLAIVSKNTESVALAAIDNHPDMVLRREDFVAWRINWRDKAENLADLVAELNLGLQSVVFIDDSPAERDRVRQALPDVLVPEWPVDKMLYTQSLRQLSCFDTANLTAEDGERAAMYRTEHTRKAAERDMGSIEEWLRSLELRVDAEPLSAATLKRATQLFNKTNQLNLATRRLPECQLDTWANHENNFVLVFRVSDRFGDYGLTGIASLTAEGDTGRVVDLVLSCRVFGRGVERAMMAALIAHAREISLGQIIATYVPTDRNRPTKAFLDDESGFDVPVGGADYYWDVSRQYELPPHLTYSGPVHA